MEVKNVKIHNGIEEEQLSNSTPTTAETCTAGFRIAKRVVVRVSASLVVLALGLPACATGTAGASDSRPVKTFKHWLEIGQASWYGLKFQGRKTATGESFDMNLMTCAHRSLPLGSWVKVTNLKNRKSVMVRVNDRGPAFDNRIVDLSFAAAQAVGLRGVGKVRLDRMRDGDPELAQALLAQVQAPVPLTPFTQTMLFQY